MNAKTLLETILARCDWVDRANTVDRVITGDEREDFDRCAVAWIPGMKELRAALDLGLRFFITHEPTFYDHHDHIHPGAEAKRAFVEQNRMTIVRLHDSWDRWPGTGMPFAWARFLGFDGPPAAADARGYQFGYDLPSPVPFRAFAAGAARRLAALGEPHPQWVGDPERAVRRIGVGTGCACDLDVFRALGCDAALVCDDGSCYWGPLQRAEDEGYPVIRVNHGTSEEPGTATLADHIRTLGLDATHLPHGCTFRLAGA